MQRILAPRASDGNWQEGRGGGEGRRGPAEAGALRPAPGGCRRGETRAQHLHGAVRVIALPAVSALRVPTSKKYMKK